jgi:undecaprenyl-diphosphatase
MLEKLLEYERDLFFALNGSDSAFLDQFMWLYSGKIVWLPLAIFVLAVITYKIPWRESVLVLLSIVLVVTLCDQFASHICKPIFERYRPTHHPDFMDEVKTVFDYRGGRFGFISSHAANAFGFAMYMTLLFRYSPLFTFTIFIWAFITAYTRIYLGVHFISDIVAGMLAGLFFGGLVYYLYTKIRAAWFKKSGIEAGSPAEIYPKNRQRLITIAIFVTVVFILFLRVQLVYLITVVR